MKLIFNWNWIELNCKFILKDKLIIKTQNWKKIKTWIKQEYNNYIIVEKLEANLNLLILRTKS